ncbi:hypothetical protein AWB65_06007 [Caballeronia humi]|uniref:Uncharacterized protein n=1 Tax=Caballeronia humi TaxID=326474 RepID=A0A158J606_9BURK|nr:hypothetical protein AWB65_06007 [Caballeronia humi]
MHRRALTRMSRSTGFRAEVCVGARFPLHGPVTGLAAR